MANLTFIYHASYLVESEKSLLIVDPWVEGGAFDNGWSLLDKSINNQTLVKYLAEIDKPKYIWLSHEHSDHFSVPFINALKESQPEVKFIFQKTLDGRVAQFIRKMGFTVTDKVGNSEKMIERARATYSTDLMTTEEYELVQYFNNTTERMVFDDYMFNDKLERYYYIAHEYPAFLKKTRNKTYARILHAIVLSNTDRNYRKKNKESLVETAKKVWNL